jgi:hypothetical protein
MTEDYSFKTCRICGGDITIDAEICPLCSSRQKETKSSLSTGIIIFLSLIGFIGISFLGIMSSHAIQQIISVRTSYSNRLALKNVQEAKSVVENYFSGKGCLPDTLAQSNFEPDKDVTIHLQKISVGRYSLVGFHSQGDMEYLAVSGKNRIYCKKRNDSVFLTHKD